jgi:hypothetical protein
LRLLRTDLLLRRPRRPLSLAPLQLRNSRRRLEQNACRQRSPAEDVPHSEFHFRLLALSR